METQEDDTIIPSKGLIGTIVHSETEAYELFKNFAHDCGFSVRKGSQHYIPGTKTIRQKWYVCSKEGFRPDSEPNYTKPEFRTGCKARIQFSVDNGEWKVTQHFNEHNHALASVDERHLLRSARSLTVIPSLRRYELFDYVKRTSIEAGDAQGLVGYFKRRAEEGIFYWDVQLDQEGRMYNLFWRDGRSRIDYECFGDVVVFDTSYRTNRYGIVCAPFIGVNHHWQNVMLGCAFLSDGNEASYEWVFKSFLESMGNIAPKSVFTDQDANLASAIRKVLPNTSHRICLANISRSGHSYLGTVSSNSEFQKLFDKCQKWCENEEEFEETWGKMLLDFDLVNNKWLNELYADRHMWSSAFTKDLFDAGINSVRRGEGTSNVLSGLASITTSLANFVLGLEVKVKEWRMDEAEEDFRCQQKDAERAIKESLMLKNASQVYTHNMYKLFEKQYLSGTGAATFKETLRDESVIYFDVTMDGANSRVSKVSLNISNMEVNCTCKKFEALGILCSHALCALHAKGIREVPSQYITQRWTKHAKERPYADSQDDKSNKDSRVSDIVFQNRIMRLAYEIGMMSEGQDDDMRELLIDGLASLKLSASGLMKHRRRGNLGKCNDIVNLYNDESPPVLDPPYPSPTDFSNARLEGQSEKRKRKLEKTTSEQKKVEPTTVLPPPNKSSQKTLLPRAFPHGFQQGVSSQGFTPQIMSKIFQPHPMSQSFQPQMMMPFFQQGFPPHGFSQSQSNMSFTSQVIGAGYVQHKPQELSTKTSKPPK